MSSLGDIVIGLKMDASPFGAGAQSARGQLSSLANMARTAAAAFGLVVGAQQIAQGVSWGVKLAADAEQAQVAFEVMLGSGQQAKSMLASLKQYSDKSPFDTIMPREAAQTLLNFGVTADQILPTIKMLGDVAAGDGQKLRGLALVFGQMSATGRLMGQDLLQFINAGFNPLQQIAARTGESMATLKKRMEAGGISAQEVTQAFRDATSEGGRFYGMTERQSKTLTGLWSTTKDTIASTLTDLGQTLIEKLDLKRVLESSIQWLQVGSDLFKTYGGEIVTVAMIIAGALVGSMVAWAAIQTVVLAKQIAIQAMSGPKGWAVIAAGIVVAAVATAHLASSFGQVESAATAAAKAAQAAQGGPGGGGGAGAAYGNTQGVEKLIALNKRMRELQQSAKLSPDVAQYAAKQEVDRVPIMQILGIEKTGQAASEASPRVKLLKDTLASLNDMRGLLPQDEIDSMSKKIQQALRDEADAASGVTTAIAKQREEIQKLQDELNPNAERERLKSAGASEEKLAELDKLKEQQKGLEDQKKMIEEMAQRKREAAAEETRLQAAMYAKAERYQDQTMTAAEKQAKELRELEELYQKGFIEQETYDRAVAQVGKSDKPVANPGAALKGSSEAAAILTRGFNSKTENLLAKQNAIAKQHLELDQQRAAGSSSAAEYQQPQTANF